MSRRTYCSGDYVKGTVLGLLDAGISFDKEAPDSTERQTCIFLSLAKIVTGIIGHGLTEQELYKGDFVRKFSETFKQLMFSEPRNKQREKQVIQLIQMINRDGRDENFSCLDELIISRLCHGIMSQMPPEEQIVAICLHLTNDARISPKA